MQLGRGRVAAAVAVFALAVIVFVVTITYMTRSPTIYVPRYELIFPTGARVRTQFPPSAHARAPLVDLPDDVSDVANPEKNMGPTMFFPRTLGTVDVDVLPAGYDEEGETLTLRDVEELRFTGCNSLGNRAGNDLSDVFAAPPSGVWTLRIELEDVTLVGVDQRALNDTHVPTATSAAYELRASTSVTDRGALQKPSTLLFARSDGAKRPTYLLRELEDLDGADVRRVYAQLHRSPIDSVDAHGGEGKRSDGDVEATDGIRLNPEYGDYDGDNDMPASISEIVLRARRGGARGHGQLLTLLPTTTLPTSAIAVAVSSARINDTGAAATFEVNLSAPSNDALALLGATRGADLDWRLVVQLYAENAGRVDVAGEEVALDLDELQTNWVSPNRSYEKLVNAGSLVDTFETHSDQGNAARLSGFRVRVSLWGRIGLGAYDGDGGAGETLSPFYTSGDIPVAFDITDTTTQ